MNQKTNHVIPHKFLPHYNDLLNETHQAYYFICKTMPVEWQSTSISEDLWKIHDAEALKFQTLKNQNMISPLNSKDSIKNQLPSSSFLDLKIELANRMLRKCDFCENKCYIDRSIGQTGFCGIPKESQVSNYDFF